MRSLKEERRERRPSGREGVEKEAFAGMSSTVAVADGGGREEAADGVVTGCDEGREGEGASRPSNTSLEGASIRAPPSVV